MSAETSPRQAWGGDTSCRPPCCVPLGAQVSVHFWPAQVTQGGWEPLLSTATSPGCAGLSHSHREQGLSWQGPSHTHTHKNTHVPFTLQQGKPAGWNFPKKRQPPPFPHQINRDTPVFHDAEESPDSRQNAWNKGWWQMSWGRSRYHHGWREQRGKVCA